MAGRGARCGGRNDEKPAGAAACRNPASHDFAGRAIAGRAIASRGSASGGRAGRGSDRRSARPGGRPGRGPPNRIRPARPGRPPRPRPLANRAGRVPRVHHAVGIPFLAARPGLVGSRHLYRVRQAVLATARAHRRHQGSRVQPARGSLPSHRRAHRPGLPAVPHPDHAAGRAGSARRDLRHPGEPRGGGQARHRRGPGDRRRVRVLLGSAATGRQRLSRDRLRGAPAGIQPVRADLRPPPGRGAVGASARLRQGGPGPHRRDDRHHHDHAGPPGGGTGRPPGGRGPMRPGTVRSRTMRSGTTRAQPGGIGGGRC